MVPKRWTEEEIDFVRQNAQKMNCRKIAAILGRPLNGVRKMRLKLRIEKRTPRIGQVFDSLVVLSEPFYVTGSGCRHRAVTVRCSKCGMEKVILISHLVTRDKAGCLCGRYDWRRRGLHPLLLELPSKSRNRLKGIWRGIKKRCSNRSYKDYHGRGIVVCHDWQDYEAFAVWAIEHGYSDTLTIERIDNDGGYSPDNCRWATNLEQSQNKRTTKRLTAFGETKSCSDWGRDSRCKTTASCIRRRVSILGWSPEKAITTPNRNGAGAVKRKRKPSAKNERTRLRQIWYKMKDRCLNRDSVSYKFYGAKGVTIATEWMNLDIFAAWAVTNGYSKELTLDRIDPYGNYGPANCRWVTKKTQARNVRKIKMVSAFGEEKSMPDWSEDSRCIVTHRLFYRRVVALGWSPERAMTTPRHQSRTTILLTYKEETHSLPEWSRITGICTETLDGRYRRGWSIERLLTEKPKR